MAQAKPVPVHLHDRIAQSPQQVMADEQAKLADARIGRQEELQPPASAIAARAIAPPQSMPSMESSRSGYTNEDELIQQMGGKARTTRATPARVHPVKVRPPAFLPPSTPITAAKQAAPATKAARQKPSFLITVGTNSDLGLSLFAPAPSDRCSGACGGSPLLVPSLPRMGGRTIAQSTPPPPYTTLPTPSLLDGAVPPGSLTNGTTPTEPLLLPTTSSPASIQPPTFRAQSATTPPARRTLLRTTALSDPSIKLQGVYLYQGDQSSARARLSISYPLTPHLLFGATFDLTDGNAFADSQTQGFSVNELYFAASLPELPNLRLVVGQLDLTSYFDRNSFAKDGATHFFNPVFQTNPALSATGIASRPAALVNWTLTDNIEAKAAVFSSSRNLGDFSLDGFAGEIGIRYGNAVIRGTYVTDRDAGSRDGFREIFQVARGNGVTGFLKGDREESYGLNGEFFIPKLKMGLFARYGRYNNDAINRSAETYSLGFNFLDVFAPDDRLGLAYGRGLSNESLRRQIGDKNPDVLELFYDFRFLPNLRLGFSIQERNDFSEIIAGVRVKTEFDVTPKGKGL
ncbi:carbohydrate porin [Stenomitos frigidus]|uniref:carbohydrate porin n=1 Tax=Stenomitos frigidus TaxID=1886765 RepID=UPI001C626369|nr:carbohydrate porin [Stenomitos frigidus]